MYLPVTLLSLAARRIAEMTIKSNDLQINNKLLQVPTFFSLSTGGMTENKIISASSFLAVLFGAIHCIEWTFIFSSHIEGLLWKISSMVITAVPFWILVVTIAYVLNSFPFLTEVAAGDWGLTGLTGLLVLLSLYISARFILITLSLMDLHNLSPEAFAVVVWSKFIPHV